MHLDGALSDLPKTQRNRRGVDAGWIGLEAVQQNLPVGAADGPGTGRERGRGEFDGHGGKIGLLGEDRVKLAGGKDRGGVDPARGRPRTAALIDYNHHLGGIARPETHTERCPPAANSGGINQRAVVVDMQRVRFHPELIIHGQDAAVDAGIDDVPVFLRPTPALRRGDVGPEDG